MSRPDCSPRLLAVIALSIFVLGVFAVDESTSTSEEFLAPPSTADEEEDISTSGSTSKSDESSSSEDSSSLATTTASASSSESDQSTGRHPEEPKLPVDLLSEDILLDPNIVLARVARQLDPRYDNAKYDSYNYHRQRPLRRNDQWTTSNIGSNQPNDRYKRRPVYPVFPGRK